MPNFGIEAVPLNTEKER